MDTQIWHDALQVIDQLSKLITGTLIMPGFPFAMAVVLCLALGYVIWFLGNKEP